MKIHTRARALLLVLLAGGAVAGGVAGAAAPLKALYDGEPVSPVIFPEQEIPLAFSHKLHIVEAGASCRDCHDRAVSSQSSLDNLIPGEEVCGGCHMIDRSEPEPESEPGTPPGRCAACHPGFDSASGTVARVRIPNPNLKFNHKVHVARGVECTTCHGDLGAEGVGLATRDQLPRMHVCLTCHQDREQASSECSTCHLTAASGKLVQRFDSGVLTPSGAMRGDAHDASFRTSHATLAQNDEEYCESCHQKEFCTACHNGVEKPLDFHGGDYLNLHAIDARRNQPDCSACHRRQTFCVGCHSRSGVSPDGKGTELGPLLEAKQFAYHPNGWVEYNPGLVVGPRTADHHSFEAQRNIRSCVGCHRENFCLNCHTAEAGSFRVNPHPSDWLGSRRCKALVARAGRMCLRCHVDVAEVSCDR